MEEPEPTIGALRGAKHTGTQPSRLVTVSDLGVESNRTSRIWTFRFSQIPRNAGRAQETIIQPFLIREAPELTCKAEWRTKYLEAPSRTSTVQTELELFPVDSASSSCAAVFS